MTTFYLKKTSGRLPLRTTLSPGTGPVRRAFARKYVLPLLLIELAVLPALSVQAQSTYEPYSFTTFAGLPPGSADGTGSAARFNSPGGVAVDSANNIYVADTSNSTIRKITPARVVSTFAGLAGSPGSANGTGSAARFNFPSGVIVDRAGTGNIYVGDTSNFTIRQITPAGVVTTLAGSPGMRGGTNGTGSAARFELPEGMAVDSAGNIYVADTDASTIRKITPGGVVSTFAGSFAKAGPQNGTGSAARFNLPTDVAVDSSNNVYVADSNNCTIRKITPAAVVTTLAGLASPGHTNGTGSAARFDFPQGVAVDSTGKIYVADSVESAIRKITPSAVVSTFAGLPGTSGYVDATGTAARFAFPRWLTVGPLNNVYVGDTFNFVVRKITPSAAVSSVVTNPANGAGEVRGVAVDNSGNIYTADLPHHTIRKITPDGTATIFAGLNDTPGSANGIGSVARFSFPTGLAVDGAGNVYVADSGNNTIRKITPAAKVTTFAGSAGLLGSADGTGTAARFYGPFGVAVDASGNVFITDTGNNTIRKITPARVVTTLGGLPLSPGTSDGAGFNARFNSPRGMAVDSAGNIYIGDTGNHTIRLGTP